MKYLQLLFVSISLLSFTSNAALKTEEVSYQNDSVNMKGFIAYDDSISGKRPGVIIVHEWWGHTDYTRDRAKMLAKLGFTAISLDMYGDGKTANHPKDAKGFAMEAKQNMDVAQARFEAGMSVLKNHSTVNPDQISALGYCFGGGIVLDMIRRGVELDLAGIFHGGLKTKSPAEPGSLSGTKVMVFNGADDQSIKLEHVQNFIGEMANAKADLTVVNYPDTVHAFTNPEATDLGKKFNFGNLRYNPEADHDSWSKFTNSLSELY